MKIKTIGDACDLAVTCLEKIYQAKEKIEEIAVEDTLSIFLAGLSGTEKNKFVEGIKKTPFLICTPLRGEEGVMYNAKYLMRILKRKRKEIGDKPLALMKEEPQIRNQLQRLVCMGEIAEEGNEYDYENSQILKTTNQIH